MLAGAKMSHQIGEMVILPPLENASRPALNTFVLEFGLRLALVKVTPVSITTRILSREFCRPRLTNYA